MGVEVAARDTVEFALDCDPVVTGAWRAAERIVAEHCPLRVVGLDSQRQVLARPGRGKRGALGILEADRDHGIAFPSIAVTANRRKPDHAGGGLAIVRPALPLPGFRSRRAPKDACQPGLRAGMRS